MAAVCMMDAGSNGVMILADHMLPPRKAGLRPAAIRVQRPVAGDLCPLPAGLAAARPGNMFVSHELMLDVGFAAARARLVNLAHGDWLSTASDGAYADGLTGLIRVGPFGDVPGACKLVRVSLLEPLPRDDTVRLPLRWEATGIMGGLFPVLDADLTLTPVGAGTLMRLDGAYRPPLAGVGAGLDRVVLHRAAMATVRSLLTRVAGALASPAPAAQPGAGRQLRLAIDPETSA